MFEEYIAHQRKSGDKKSQSLHAHLAEGSKEAGKIASKVGLQAYGELIGLLHDFGKASEEFRQYLHSALGLIDPDADDYVDAAKKKGKVDHSSAGAQLIFRLIEGNDSQANFVKQILSLCIASHHSGLTDCLSPEGEDL